MLGRWVFGRVCIDEIHTLKLGCGQRRRKRSFCSSWKRAIAKALACCRCKSCEETRKEFGHRQSLWVRPVSCRSAFRLMPLRSSVRGGVRVWPVGASANCPRVSDREYDPAMPESVAVARFGGAEWRSATDSTGGIETLYADGCRGLRISIRGLLPFDQDQNRCTMCRFRNM